MDWTTLTGELNLEALSEQIEQLFPNFSIDFSSLLGQILSGNAGFFPAGAGIHPV